MFQFLPPALSTARDYSAHVCRVLEDLIGRMVQAFRETFTEAEEEAALIAVEMGRSHHSVHITLTDAFSHRTRRFMPKRMLHHLQRRGVVSVG